MQAYVDHRPMLAAILTSGYDGWITLECAAPFPPKERLAYDLAEIERQLEAVREGKRSSSLE